MSSARGSSRGPWRSRYQGRGYRSNYQQSTRNTTTALRPPSPPFGPLLQTINELYLDDILKATEDDGELVTIASCECVASFNWLGHSEPTILVPGTFLLSESLIAKWELLMLTFVSLLTGNIHRHAACLDSPD